MRKVHKVTIGIARELKRVRIVGAYRITAHIRATAPERAGKADLFYRVTKGGKFTDHGDLAGAMVAATTR